MCYILKNYYTKPKETQHKVMKSLKTSPESIKTNSARKKYDIKLGLVVAFTSLIHCSYLSFYLRNFIHAFSVFLNSADAFSSK